MTPTSPAWAFLCDILFIWMIGIGFMAIGISIRDAIAARRQRKRNHRDGLLRTARRRDH